MNKFDKYYSDPEKVKELSEYVHMNFKLIQTKMVSEMRRKLDINPSMDDSEGYLSLMISLYGRMFNEFIYGLSGYSRSLNVKVDELIPAMTLKIFLDLYEGKNPLQGRMRSDVKEDLEGFKKYYLDNIDSLREHKEALPK